VVAAAARPLGVGRSKVEVFKNFEEGAKALEKVEKLGREECIILIKNYLDSSLKYERKISPNMS